MRTKFTLSYISSASSPCRPHRREDLLLLVAGLRREESTAQLERREELLQGDQEAARIRFLLNF